MQNLWDLWINSTQRCWCKWSWLSGAVEWVKWCYTSSNCTCTPSWDTKLLAGPPFPEFPASLYGLRLRNLLAVSFQHTLIIKSCSKETGTILSTIVSTFAKLFISYPPCCSCRCQVLNRLLCYLRSYCSYFTWPKIVSMSYCIFTSFPSLVSWWSLLYLLQIFVRTFDDVNQWPVPSKFVKLIACSETKA